jgi:hypothetical protein
MIPVRLKQRSHEIRHMQRGQKLAQLVPGRPSFALDESLGFKD